MISKLPNKSCDLDPIPVSLLKDCTEQLAPIITEIINTSLLTGEFPESLKQARVRPLLKKPNLDPENLANYRPVSNLSLMSKLIERAACSQITEYISHNNLHADCQSAYRSGHSTETALLRVQNAVLRSLDERREVILIMLDLSAAFDTIDHDILLSRLRSRFGFGSTALGWLSSYLSGRTQCVTVGSVLSDEHRLKCGVPQGSVLGPVLFSLYMVPMEDIIIKHGFQYMMYADDTQLYVTCESNHIPSQAIEACVDEIRHWMRDNLLALNDDKTEIVHFSSKFSARGQPRHDYTLDIGGLSIAPSVRVRNLGVIMDSTGTMSAHVSNLCRAASFALWKINKIRNLLDQSSTEKLIHAFITSRLDYCNSLLFGLPMQEMNKLQIVQNSAARLVTLNKKYDHITPVLEKLHWLPVQQRTKFKILCLTHKVLHDAAPSYLCELLSRRVANRTLRNNSNGEIYLSQPLVSNHFYGSRAFSVGAPSLWNNLPRELVAIRDFNCFKSKLKTHLFREYFCS